MSYEKRDRFTLLVVIVTGLALGCLAGYATSAEVEYPMPSMSAGDEAGLLRPKAEPPRTTPVAETAPKFDPIPPVDNVVPVTPAAGGLSLTPDQKEQLMGFAKHALSLLVGALLGSGSASPFMATVLTKLLAMFGGAVPPATPAKVRAKRKAVKAK
jgi:hypothetical protein